MGNNLEIGRKRRLGKSRSLQSDRPEPVQRPIKRRRVDHLPTNGAYSAHSGHYLYGGRSYGKADFIVDLGRRSQLADLAGIALTLVHAFLAVSVR